MKRAFFYHYNKPASLRAGHPVLTVQHDESDYWHLSDYAVSSRSGMLLVMIPRNLPTVTHADNGWKYHYPY
jgi:hypothetical protein